MENNSTTNEVTEDYEDGIPRGYYPMANGIMLQSIPKDTEGLEFVKAEKFQAILLLKCIDRRSSTIRFIFEDLRTKNTYSMAWSNLEWVIHNIANSIITGEFIVKKTGAFWALDIYKPTPGLKAKDNLDKKRAIFRTVEKLLGELQ